MGMIRIIVDWGDYQEFCASQFEMPISQVESLSGQLDTLIWCFLEMLRHKFWDHQDRDVFKPGDGIVSAKD